MRIGLNQIGIKGFGRQNCCAPEMNAFLMKDKAKAQAN